MKNFVFHYGQSNKEIQSQLIIQGVMGMLEMEMNSALLREMNPILLRLLDKVFHPPKRFYNKWIDAD